MRNGARPRRKSPVEPPELPEQPRRPRPDSLSGEAPPLLVEATSQSNDDAVDLLVRVPIEALSGPIDDSNLDLGAVAETDADAALDRSPVRAKGDGSDPGDGFFGALKAAEVEVEARAVEAQPQPGRVDDRADASQADQVRFARLHLRTGSLLQARSEFEALAACDLLDVPSTLDLAEVRWRTGDLIGAGMAANDYLAAKGEEVLGHLIAAEAAASANRTVEARQHADRALERSLSNLDGFFAGVPRRMSWPETTWTAPAAVKIETPVFEAPAKKTASLASETRVEAPLGSLWEPEIAAVEQAADLTALEPDAHVALESTPVAPATEQTEPSVAETAPAISEPQLAPVADNTWGGEIGTGTASLEAGDALMAALHFAIALRTSPESARAVLDAIGEHSDLALGLVRGDALRLLGNESEAGQAYASVALRLGPNKPAASVPAPEPAPKPATAPVAKARAQKRAHEAAARVEAPEPPPGPAPEPVANVEAPEPPPGPAPEPVTKVEAPEPPPAIRWE